MVHASRSKTITAGSVSVALWVSIAALACVLGVFRAEAASLRIMGQTTGNIGTASEVLPYSNTSPTGPIHDIVQTKLDSCCGYVSSDARSTAGYGYLRAEAFSITTGLNDPGFGSLFSTGGSSAGWTDTLTISRPNSFPSVGVVTVHIDVGGNLSATDGGGLLSSALAGYSVVIYSPNCAGDCLTKSGEVRSVSIGGPIPTGDPPGPFTAEIPFVFDTPFEIRVDLGVYTQADGGSEPGVTSIGSATFGNTLTWEGISEVRGDAQQVVTDYSVMSESGVDYAEPVPEPASGSGLAASAVLFAVAKRRSLGRFVGRRPLRVRFRLLA